MPGRRTVHVANTQKILVVIIIILILLIFIGKKYFTNISLNRYLD